MNFFLYQGLGLKIIGGTSSSGEEHGIFVKQLVPGGLAALSGRLKPGDQLLEVTKLVYTFTVL